MDRYTKDTDPFEEDTLPPWLAKQQEDDRWVETELSKKEKTVYKEGDIVGIFRFVRYAKYKNRAVFQCMECGRKFQYNIHTIKKKKRCKWYRFHPKTK